MLKRFGVISHMMFLDMQDYEEIVTHYNLSNSHDKPVSVFNNDSYDIFGFLPQRTFFAATDVISKIAKEFESNVGLTVVFGSESFETGTPFFVKKDKELKVSSYQEILDFVNDKEKKRQVLKENLFAHYK